MPEKIILTFIILLLWFSTAFAQKQIEPPYILRVKYSPQNPKENEKINFTAEVKPFSKESGKLKVYLYYSSDNGKNYENIEMQNKDNFYTATLNGFKKNTEIIYSVKVLDENNLSSVQIPVINNISNTDFKPTNLPIFSPLVIDEDKENNLPDELNIDEFAVGYGESGDKKLLYGVVKMKDKINEGTLSPTKINAVSILLQNPDIEIQQIIEGKNPLVYTSFLLTKNYVPGKNWIDILWSPLLVELGGHAMFDLPDCYAIDSRVVTTYAPIPYAEALLQCYNTTNQIYWIMKYNLLGNNPSKNILFATNSFIIQSTSVDFICPENSQFFNEMCGNLFDHAPLTRFYLPSNNQQITIAN